MKFYKVIEEIIGFQNIVIKFKSFDSEKSYSASNMRKILFRESRARNGNFKNFWKLLKTTQ